MALLPPHVCRPTQGAFARYAGRILPPCIERDARRTSRDARTHRERERLAHGQRQEQRQGRGEEQRGAETGAGGKATENRVCGPLCNSVV